jgi:AcrR family transcriptional regulator
MSPRGKEQNEQMRKETFEKITKGALEVFSKYGFYGTTIKKITEASGLSYGLVYYYFPSKEQIFIYLVEEALRQSQAVFERELEDDGSPWEILSRFAETLLHESLSGDSTLYFHIMLQALTQGDEFTELQSKIAEYNMRLYELMIPIIVAGQAEGSVSEGDPMGLITAFLSLVQGLALFTRNSENNHPAVTPEILLNVLKK